MPFNGNMGPKERGLRVVVSAALFVVGATIIHNRVARDVFYAVGACAMLAALTGYGPLYPFFLRLRGENKKDIH